MSESKVLKVARAGLGTLLLCSNRAIEALIALIPSVIRPRLMPGVPATCDVAAGADIGDEIISSPNAMIADEMQGRGPIAQASGHEAGCCFSVCRGAMYLKSVVMIVFLAALGAGTLSLRQQQWEARHNIAQMHKQIEQTRRATWDSQAKIAAELHPDKLEHKLMIAKLEMDPITASNDPQLRRLRVVEPAIAPTPGKSKSSTKARPSATKNKTKRRN